MASSNISPNLLLLLLFLPLVSILILLPLITAHPNSPHYCNHTCGEKHVSYPFGFSSGCPIQLNCSLKGAMLLYQQYPVLYVNDSGIRISLQPQCNRSIENFNKLFTKNFAPSSTNAILLYNCSVDVSPCNITDIKVHLEPLHCANNTSISCIYNRDVGFFFHRNETQLKQCKYLLSSISLNSLNDSGVSLDISVMDLAWWLPGNCNSCSQHADCSKVPIPAGGGHRCRCKNGFVGDGFAGGTGCKQASCNLAEYWSGDCGGAARFVILIGGTVGVVSLPIGIGMLCCYIRRRRRHPKSKGFKKLRLSEVTGIEIPIYPYKEIEKATNNFSDKQRLGTGAFGTVYAGKLNNELWVAIKRIKQNDTSIEQVRNEIKLISSVNHPNLVRLLGCSIEYGEQILVYEFMPNGTLSQHLKREKGHGLTWPVRLTIACETAQAIAHLHSAIDPPIYHRDIKSSNILLDYNLRSKVADFGLSRLGMTEISHISTAPQGTPGYLDPQYHQNFHLSDKSDVYSFGVVLVEIITSLKVVDFCRPQNEVNLAALAVDRIGKGRLDEIIDPYLDIKSDDWICSVHKVAELAFRCLAFDRDMRPSMMEVAAELEQIRVSKWDHLEEIHAAGSANSSSLTEPSSSSSSSSIVSDKPLSFNRKKDDQLGNKDLFTAVSRVKSMDGAKDNSPVSVQDSWPSEQSSPSSSSLISTVTR